MSSIQWLNAEELAAWVGLLSTFGGLDTALDRQLQRDSGISHATYGVLVALSRADDGVRHMSDLAGMAGFSQSRLSHAVRRLEQDGLLTRNDCPHDRRAVHATLTEKGRAVLEAAAPGHVAAVRRYVFDRLSADQVSALAEITRTISDGLRTDGVLDPLDSPAHDGRP